MTETLVKCRCKHCRTWDQVNGITKGQPTVTQEDLLCDYCRINCSGEIMP